jgi:hypothetical protein
MKYDYDYLMINDGKENENTCFDKVNEIKTLSSILTGDGNYASKFDIYMMKDQ